LRISREGRKIVDRPSPERKQHCGSPISKINRTIVVLVNLKPARFAGEVSEWMLLCAEKEDGSQCILLTTEKPVDPGTSIT